MSPNTATIHYARQCQQCASWKDNACGASAHHVVTTMECKADRFSLANDGSIAEDRFIRVMRFALYNDRVLACITFRLP